ncbi:MAG: cyoD [Bacilli bacterium]|nr:cyoD [Bacilli bacterium]
MSNLNENIQGHVSHERGMPWAHIIGFIISLILTAIPLWMTLAHSLTYTRLLMVILVFAVAQILVQLFFFMHVRESRGPRWHIWMLVLGFILTFTIVAASIWIMTFGAESY